MASSWNKRHSHEETDRIRRERKRYAKWKEYWVDSDGKWKKVPIKIGDSWNARLNCWNNEIYRGERDSETGELTEKGQSIKSWNETKESIENEFGSGISYFQILAMIEAAEPCPKCHTSGAGGISVSTTEGEIFSCTVCSEVTKMATSVPGIEVL